MPQASQQPQRAETRGARYWRLSSRFLGAAVVAFGISNLVFIASYAVGASAAVATVLAWLAGAIPNFLLNRRTWGGGGREALRREVVRYGVISVLTALLAAYVTSKAEDLAQVWFPGPRSLAHIAVVYGGYAGTYLVVFVLKFFLIDRLVFTGPPQRERVR